MPHFDDLQRQVFAEQVATLHRLAPFTLATSVAAATITWLMLDVAGQATTLWAWMLAHHAVTLGRYGLVRAYRRMAPGAASAPLWGWLFLAGVLAAGAVWGLLGTAFRPPAGHPLAGAAVVIVFAVAAIGLFTLAPMFRAYAAFALPMLVPAVASLLIAGDAADRTYGVAVGVFALVALANARRVSRTFAEGMRLRLELARAADEREAARATAEAASRAKSEFLANMSHEIRTPLNGIVGTAELLAATTADERQRRYVDALQRSASGLLEIVNDILDLAKVEAGRVELAPADFDLRECVADVVETMRPRAEAKGLALELAVAADAPGDMRADPVRLRQVVANLLGNAIKFTERGGVRVTLAGDSAEGGRALRVAVADTGIGMTPAQQARIFDAFTQADASFTRKYGGTGLGLTISRQLVELMGGRIGVESAPGAGTTFWFTARYDAAQAPASPAPAAAPAPLAPLRGRVLVVEDNEMNVTVAHGMLAALGVDAVVASNGRDALRIAAAGGVDLVLMDCQMPELDGFESTRLIRAAEAREPARRRLPIVALTASAVSGDRERCLAAGMDDYLAKPFRLAALHAKLQPWLAPSAAPGAASGRAAADPEACRLDESVLERLRAEHLPVQPDMVATVVRMFVERSAALLEALRNALAEGVAADARRHAHTLKSNCQHVGAEGLATLARRAESAARDGDLAATAALAAQIEPALAVVRTRLAARHLAPAGEEISTEALGHAG